MSYEFHGVLVLGPGRDAAAAALVEQFRGRAARFEAPVPGVAVAFAADHDLSKGAVDRDALPPMAAIQAWSTRHPGADVIALSVECFGGVCDQSGAAMRGGQALAVIDPPEIDHPAPSPLSRLFAALGVPNAETRFAPLERGFFPARSD